MNQFCQNSSVYCFSLLGVVTPLQRPGKNTDKTTMGGHKQVTCKICSKSMRSDTVKRHMKVHSTEDQNENNEQICQDIVMEMLDKNFTQEGSATERNQDGERDCTTGERNHDGERDCTTEKRKYDGDDNQSASKRKCEEIATDKSVNGDFIIYCAHCNYATKRQYNMRRHMDTHNMRRHMGTKHSHTKADENQHIPFKGSVECNDVGEALEVWKIYKLLQRMSNK